MDLPSRLNDGQYSKSVSLVRRLGVPLGSDFCHRCPTALKTSVLSLGDVTPWRIMRASKFAGLTSCANRTASVMRCVECTLKGILAAVFFAMSTRTILPLAQITTDLPSGVHCEPGYTPKVAYVSICSLLRPS